MKNIFSCLTIFIFQINYNSYTPRITRQCHLRYSDEHFRKDMGNGYLQEALEKIRKERHLQESQVLQKNQTARSVSSRTRKPFIAEQDLSSLLIIKSILPDIYHPPQIRSFEILPKK